MPFVSLLVLLLAAPALAAQSTAVLLRPDRVFDAERVHPGWAVLVRDSLIAAAGPAATLAAPADARRVRGADRLIWTVRECGSA